MSVAISVVIPTCNSRPALLAETLKCALGQSSPAHEIIVVANGPKPLDQTTLPGGVRVVELESGAGAAKARNAGAQQACGEYVAFLDDDDLWEKDYLKKISLLVASGHPDCVVSRLDLLEGESIRPFKNARGQLTPKVLLVQNPGATGTATVVCKKAFLALGGYDASLPTSEDKALVLDMLLAGMRVVAAPEAQALLRAHAGERLSNPGSMLRGSIRFLEKYGHLMTLGQRFRNLAKIRRYRAESTGRIFDYLCWSPFLIGTYLADRRDGIAKRLGID